MNISINFKLLTYQPGSRGYNQAIFEPVSDFFVSVEVPVKYLVNAEEYLTAPMQSNKPPTPILTVEGWAFVEDIFLKRSATAEIAVPDDNVDWEEE